MNDVTALHNHAMRLLDSAFSARRSGDRQAFQKLVTEALSAETQAAQELATSSDFEPSRSVLYRSAASLAMLASKFDLALTLAAAGITATTPNGIRDELVQVIKEASYHVRLKETEGVSLADETLTMSLEGNEVGNGVVRSDVFATRIGALTRVVRRTNDRVLGLPFLGGRSTGRGLQQYVSAPLAGSFAIEVRLGHIEQGDLPGYSIAESTLSELVACFELFQAGDLGALHQRIEDPIYYSNFMALARELMPDGEAIKTVDLSANLNRGPLRVRITATRKRALSKPLDVAPNIHEPITIVGVLRFADATHDGKDTVKVVADDGQIFSIHVPVGLLDDIVKPLWGTRVEVFGSLTAPKKRLIELETISPAPPEG